MRKIVTSPPAAHNQQGEPLEQALAAEAALKAAGFQRVGGNDWARPITGQQTTGSTGQVMKQHAEVTVKLNLWLDVSMDEDAITTHVRSSLPAAFGEALIEMQNPVDIIDIRQEAEIYGTAEAQLHERTADAPYIVFQLADDEATYGADAGKFIVTTANAEDELSGPMSEKDAAAFAAALNACQMVTDRWEKGDLAEAARACGEALVAAKVA